MKKLIIASFIFFSLIPGLCLAQDTESSGRNLKNAFKEVQEEVGNNAG
ncbi:hypothetical protein GW934_03010, partial [Candidatus Falkowbacteria bacterium]|nr:hypothetical protein [Candidatus Falkowbacteria bacterium]